MTTLRVRIAAMIDAGTLTSDSEEYRRFMAAARERAADRDRQRAGLDAEPAKR